MTAGIAAAGFHSLNPVERPLPEKAERYRSPFAYSPHGVCSLNLEGHTHRREWRSGGGHRYLCVDPGCGGSFIADESTSRNTATDGDSKGRAGQRPRPFLRLGSPDRSRYSRCRRSPVRAPPIRAGERGFEPSRGSRGNVARLEVGAGHSMPGPTPSSPPTERGLSLTVGQACAPRTHSIRKASTSWVTSAIGGWLGLRRPSAVRCRSHRPECRRAA